jgi:LmbE family N-acetylglucosaminyl deacetylase
VTAPAPSRHPIDAPGTDEQEWSAWPWLSVSPRTWPGDGPAGLGEITSAVIVAAHPDDEVLGAGGLISMLATARARLRLVAVTDGEASHRGHADPGELARTRTAETAAALRALGAPAAEVIRLRLPDSGLAGHEDELAATLAPLVAGFSLCLAPWHHDMHPDHEAAGRATRSAMKDSAVKDSAVKDSAVKDSAVKDSAMKDSAVQNGPAPGALYYYPVWMWHWARPGDPRIPWDQAWRVPLSARAAAGKRAAIGCFTSQVHDRGHGLGPVLTPAMIAHFTRPAEVLLP